MQRFPDLNFAVSGEALEDVSGGSAPQVVPVDGVEYRVEHQVHQQLLWGRKGRLLVITFVLLPRLWGGLGSVPIQTVGGAPAFSGLKGFAFVLGASRYDVGKSFRSFDFDWPLPLCRHLDLIYTMKFMQPPLLCPLLHDPLLPPMRTSYLEAP